jgi:hypothetical protein
VVTFAEHSTMNLRQALLIPALLATSYASAQVAYDDASDPTYDSGWSEGSNGGYGFQPWTFYNDQPETHFKTGDSTGGGLHPGINTGGRAFSFEYLPFGGISANRFFDSDVVYGQSFGIDVLNQDPTDHSISRLEIYTTNYNGLTCGIWSGTVMVAFFGVETFYYTMPTEAGVHFDIEPLASGKLKTTVRSLKYGETHSVTSSWNNYGPLDFFNISSTGTGNPDRTFVNRMQVVSVPEPGTFAILGVALTLLSRRCRAKPSQG